MSGGTRWAGVMMNVCAALAEVKLCSGGSRWTSPLLPTRPRGPGSLCVPMHAAVWGPPLCPLPPGFAPRKPRAAVAFFHPHFPAVPTEKFSRMSERPWAQEGTCLAARGRGDLAEE